MPYIIETRMAAEPPNQNVAVRAAVLTRTAVATLADTEYAVDLAIEEHGGSIDEWPDIPESGGTVGPLPDGTVIEVRRVKWRDITVAVDLRDVLPTRENMLAAFNAA
jgi:hypothetical protein